MILAKCNIVPKSFADIQISSVSVEDSGRPQLIAGQLQEFRTVIIPIMHKETKNSFHFSPQTATSWARCFGKKADRSGMEKFGARARTNSMKNLLSMSAQGSAQQMNMRNMSHSILILCCSLILAGFIITVPVAYYMMNSWLQNFVFRINISVKVFVIAVLVSMIIAWLTVGYKSIKAAIANPVKSLRTE